MIELNTFNPFGKDVSELKTSDLLILKGVHEGWYVDYKVGGLKARGYAKAISAMANTYGGWIFVGVQEESRDNNVAGSFPGIGSDQIDQTCQRIRQSAAEHLNPLPFFELRVVEVPQAKNKEKVICVYVPASSKAPIVHSDGRIYRRVNDSSEPVAENNRDAIEHLFQRTKGLQEWYSDWYDRDPELSYGEENVSYLRIFAVPDYWDEERLWYKGSSEDFRELLNSPPRGMTFSHDYTDIYTRSTGFICRAVNMPDARQIATTLIFDRDLKNEIWLPLPSFKLSEYSDYYNKSTELDDVVNYLIEKGYENCKGLNLTQAFGAVDSFFALQRKFQQYLGYKGETHVKYKLMNVRRHIPLIEASPADLNWVNYGIPLILRNEVVSPRDGAIETFIPIDLHQKENDTPDDFGLCVPVFLDLLFAAGLGVGSTTKFSELFQKAMMTSFDRAIKKT